MGAVCCAINEYVSGIFDVDAKSTDLKPCPAHAQEISISILTLQILHL